ncbi:MAG: ATP-binding protein, partial [Candidatus Parvarchaeota archaeon]|nr:ATP-binding protein [Candidatus Parvarchaeum tengchongense]
GGYLFLGINDDKTICGIEEELSNMSKGNDGYIRGIVESLNTKFGPTASLLISIRIQTYKNKKICIIYVKKSSKPVFINENGRNKFFIRQQNSIKELDAKYTNEYIKENFNKNSNKKLSKSLTYKNIKSIKKQIKLSQKAFESFLSKYYKWNFADPKNLKSDPNKLIYKIHIIKNYFILIYSRIFKNQNINKPEIKQPITVVCCIKFKNRFELVADPKYIEKAGNWRKNLHLAIEELKKTEGVLFLNQALKLLGLKSKSQCVLNMIKYIGTGNYKFGPQNIISVRFILETGEIFRCNLVLSRTTERQIIKKELIKEISKLKQANYRLEVLPNYLQRKGLYIKFI